MPLTMLNKIVDELTKQISAKTNSSLALLEIITEYINVIEKKKSLKQLRYLGAAEFPVFLQCSGMSVRIERLFSENVKCGPSK